MPEAKAIGLVTLCIALLGIAVWDLPVGDADRNSDLGAAIAGGAVVAGALLILQQSFASQFENRTVRFQVGLQKEVSGLDLRRQDLSDVYWREINLTDAHLARAKLSEATLWDTVFVGAFLWGADLTKADLWGADLSGANLQGARLVEAYLQDADLTGANLGADADLPGGPYGAADLTGADLTGADFSGANLEGADLTGVKYSLSTTVWPLGFDTSTIVGATII